MKRFVAVLLAGSVCLLVAVAQKSASPFAGRWDFNTAPGQANWLGVAEKDGSLEIRFQPTGGHVRKIADFKLEGPHLTLNIDRATDKNPAMTWELDAAGGKLTGVQKRGAATIQLTGVPAPALDRNPPAAWSDPEPLFNGKDLTGWEPTDPAHNNWAVENGDLVNKAHGANLRGTRKFDDFKLHIEFNCPDDGNSGVYLHGVYELQIYDSENNHIYSDGVCGAIYGQSAPMANACKQPGQWQTFDVVFEAARWENHHLVRPAIVTVFQNGVLIHYKQPILGPSGHRILANYDTELPATAPLSLQEHGDVVRFRNIWIRNIPEEEKP